MVKFEGLLKALGIEVGDYKEELGDSSFITITNPYMDKGVTLLEMPQGFMLNYNGILAKSGAQEIYALVGFGDNNNWIDVQEHSMHLKTEQNFDLLLPMDQQKEIHVAFKDGAGNWDNNSGGNYSFRNNFYDGE